MTAVQLSVPASVTLDASGAGEVTVGPDAGPPVWHITKVVVSTSRPGQAPVPRFQLLDEQGRVRGQTYDGSYDESDFDLILTRGQHLTGQWTGGNSGDQATMWLYGERLMA